MKTVAFALSLALLAGCATTREPFIVEGTPSAVTVNWANSRTGSSGALEAADAHCQKHGKAAQFAGRVSDFTLAYNCVKPG